MNILSTKNLTKEFILDNKKINVIDDISLQVKKGEFLAVMGPSGSGKSTLLSLIASLDEPTKGTIEINGKNITGESEEKVAEIRNKTIGFVFQSFNLIPTLNTYENIILPLEIANAVDKNKVDKIIKRVGLENRKNSYSNQLSGGEQQRVAIARAIINNPLILFADEPTGNLDSKNSKNVLNLLLELKDEFEMTLVLVTHDENISKKADRIVYLKDGKIKKILSKK